jgi:hypothetical protein
MQILVPIASLKELRALAVHGVKEVYCGFLSKRWASGYSNLASVNRVERYGGNVTDPGEFQEICSFAHQRGVKVYLALNSLYSSQQYTALNQELDTIARFGIDALIVADMGLVALLKKRGFNKDLHASTGLTVFNSEEVRFLKEMGFSRIVLPRSLAKSEISALLANNKDMEFEVFIMNGRCQNIDGFCTFQHGLSDLYAPWVNKILINSGFGNYLQERLAQAPAPLRNAVMRTGGAFLSSAACSLDYRSKSSDGNHCLNRQDFIDTMYSCGGCHIHDFLQWGVVAAKIVGRSLPLKRKINDLVYLQGLVDYFAHTKADYAGFCEFSKKSYRKIYGAACRQNCYY